MRNQNTGETLGILKKKKAVDGARESLNTSHTHKKEEAGNLFPSPFPFQSKPICSMGTRKTRPKQIGPSGVCCVSFSVGRSPTELSRMME